MKRAFALVVASVVISIPALAQDRAPDMFKDLDPGHWAYAATEFLRSKNILIGYPDGYFRGKRTLTRYEFAVALDRALKTFMAVPGPKGPMGEKGDAGEKGEAGPAGAPGMTPEEVATFKRLVDEFKKELAAKGNDINAVNRRLDGLAKDVGDIKNTLNNMPRVYGNVFFGARFNTLNKQIADWDGRQFDPGDNVFTAHTFQLGVKANINGGAKLDAAVNFDNYKNLTGGSIAHPFDYASSPPGDVFIQKLEIKTPFNGLGKGSSLTLGRFGYYGSNYTVWRPDVDRYFDNPIYDNGLYYLDGAQLDAKIGSVNLGVVGGQFASVRGTNGGPYNLPYAGAMSAPLFINGDKPVGEVYPGSVPVEQMLGVTARIPLHFAGGGYTRFSAYDTSSGTTGYSQLFHEVYILGTDGRIRFCHGMDFFYDIGKSITHNGPNHYVGTHQNVGGEAGIDWNRGRLSAGAGYKYIDPLFYNPGDWDWIGNWLNPVNIQGPKAHVKYDLSQMLGVHLSGEHYTPVHNRAAIGGLGSDDEIFRAQAGMRFNLSKNFRTTIDWEGVYWTLEGAHSGIPGIVGKVHPTENYFRFGTGYHLTDSTQLRLGYETGAFDGHNAFTGGYGGGGGGGYGNGYGAKYSYSAVTTQVGVKF